MIIALKVIALVGIYALGVATPKGLSKLAEWYLAKTAIKVAKATSTTSETTKTK